MDFLTYSDPRVVFAFWLGVVVLAMALVVLVVIIAMRQSVLRKERNHRRAAAFWHRTLADVVNGSSAPVPTLPRRDISGFIDAWNQLHDSLHGELHPGLQRAAREVGLERQLYLAIDHGGFHNRVMSIIAMGYLRSHTHFEKLAHYLDDRSSVVSLCAARSLMQIDPDRAVEMFVPHIVTRTDWSQDGVAGILQEVGSETLTKELSDVTLQATADVAPRLVRFLAGVSPAAARPVIRRIVSASPDEHLVSTCLQVLTHPDDLDLVRPLLGSTRWHVRMHAASALGRLGEPGDEHRLVPLLADPQWWVRYRAAQALAKLPFLSELDLRRVRAGQRDRFACDILDQVLAERNMGAQV